MGFKKVTILGVGLIGASLAMAMKRKSLCEHVTGYGRNESNLRRAKETGIIDSYEQDPARACEGSDLVVFATPVETFKTLAEMVRGVLRKGTAVIDVGSVKGKLVYEMEGLMPEGVGYVGCHPIAGSERSGLDASSAGLFEGARCIITKTGNTEAGLVEKATRLWETLGCHVEFLSPEEHDKVYGLMSHFPHLAAYAMLNTVGDVDSRYVGFAGPGFMDTTRISLSSPTLWRNICLMNRENLIEFMEIFKENIDKLSLCLKNVDAEGLDRAFERARALRESIGN